MKDFATIYLPTNLPDFTWLANQSGVSDFQVISKIGDPNIQYKLKLLDMQLTMNVMQPGQIYDHLAGFSNYILSLQLQRKSNFTAPVLEQIAKTKTVIGCVIEPGLDVDGFMGGLLTVILTKYQGLMFARDCVFGSDGIPLIQG